MNNVSKAEIAPSELGGVMTAVGAALILVTSALYALNPFFVALPPLPQGMADAAAAESAQRGGWLFAAGFTGVLGDLILGSGCLLLSRLGRSAWESLGWLVVGIGVLAFIVPDTIFSLVLPEAGRSAFYLPFRRLFDVSFMVASLMAVIGESLLLVNELLNKPRIPAWLCWLGLAGDLCWLAAILAGLNGVGWYAFWALGLVVPTFVFLVLGLRLRGLTRQGNS